MSELTRREALRLALAGSAALATDMVSPNCSKLRAGQGTDIDWYAFPDTSNRFAVCGLPFFPQFADNSLWRLPRAAYADRDVPDAVVQGSKAPAGGRIRFRSNTTRLRFEVTTSTADCGRPAMSLVGSHALNVHVDRQNWAYALAPTTQETTPVSRSAFEEVVSGASERDFDIYLPIARDLKITRIGLSKGSTLAKPSDFPKSKTFMLYGSSIAQGMGACRAGMTYEAVLARVLNWDFVNFGFGGAGKGEPSVLKYLVQTPKPHCLLLDVGLSFYQKGSDHATRYKAMLDQFRTAYPDSDTYIVCTQPILGPARHTGRDGVTRQMAVSAAAKAGVDHRVREGDKKTFLVDGNTDLLDASKEPESFHDLLHPNDLGYWRIANRLLAKLKAFGIIEE